MTSTQETPQGAAAPATEGRPRRRRILVCRPEYFTVDYVINPWMQGNTDRPVHEKVVEQWQGLRDTFARHGDVEELAPVDGLPDLVFTANAGVVLDDKFLCSHFRHPQRRGEETVFARWFGDRGYEVGRMPEGVYFEGAGDALFCRRDPNRLWMGYGFRTVLDAAEHIAGFLDIEVKPLRLVDERFYHLDTCFCPLDGGRLVYYADGFDDRSRRAIEEYYAEEDRHAVSERDAVHFACNAVDLGGTLVMNNCTAEMEERLRAWGFDVIRQPLGQFIMSGGSAKCLSLRLDEHLEAGKHARRERSEPLHRTLVIEGHLLDTGMMARAFDIITEAGGNFETLKFEAGRRPEDKSSMRLKVLAIDEDQLDEILAQLIEMGAALEDGGSRPAELVDVEIDGVAPDDFYSTTIYPTDVLVEGEWIRCDNQRMDGVIAVEKHADGAWRATVSLIRDLRRGQKVVTGVDGLRIHQHTPLQQDPAEFQFMSSSVSSERRVELAVDGIAWEMDQIRDRGGKIVFVPGPVVVHTGGVPYLCELVREGYVHAILSGNALATHDIERALFGTSLGVDLQRGVTVHGGHRHHLSAINSVRRCGNIPNAVAQGVLKSGLMYELVKAGVPFCLSGSIRDDGPLPDTEMDLVKAQEEYARLLRGADMVIMLSTMLHSIGVGNMTPAGVKLVCVDINTAVVTKLADRGSVEATPVVTDVGLFLNLLVRKLRELQLDEPGA